MNNPSPIIKFLAFMLMIYVFRKIKDNVDSSKKRIVYYVILILCFGIFIGLYENQQRNAKAKTTQDTIAFHNALKVIQYPIESEFVSRRSEEASEITSTIPQSEVSVDSRYNDKILTQSEINKLGRSLGYLIGQNISLQKIKSLYPDLGIYAQTAEMEFKASFGKAEESIILLLKNEMGDKFQSFYDTIVAQNLNLIEQQEINRDLAVTFIEEIKRRSTGEIPSPIRETILYYQFRENPVEEFIKRFIQKYSTHEHKKSEGLNVQIEYPSSWTSEEGKRPGIIQNLIGYNSGKGSARVVLGIRDLLKEAKQAGIPVSSEEVALSQTREGSSSMLYNYIAPTERLHEYASSQNFNNIRDSKAKTAIVDGWPCTIFEFTGETKRIIGNLSIYNKTYMIMYKNFLISFNASVGKFPQESEEAFQMNVRILSRCIFH